MIMESIIGGLAILAFIDFIGRIWPIILVIVGIIALIFFGGYLANLYEINNPYCPECNERSNAEIKDIQVYSVTAVQRAVASGYSVSHCSSTRREHLIPSHYHHGYFTHYKYKTFYRNNYLVLYKCKHCGHTFVTKRTGDIGKIKRHFLIKNEERQNCLEDNLTNQMFCNYNKNSNGSQLIGNNTHISTTETETEAKAIFNVVGLGLQLHEAMAQLLRDAPNQSMNTETLSDSIYEQGLYCEQAGDKADASRIKATAKNYDNLFCIIGDIIKLEGDKMVNLLKEFQKYDPAVVPSCAGNYIVCLKENAELPDIGITAYTSLFDNLEVVYIGISSNLKDRIYKRHFNGNAGQSTLRKSIGSLFGYAKIPRDKIENGYTKFNDSDETKLSEWMKNNMVFYYFANDNSSNNENGLIKYFDPPLNIEKTKELLPNSKNNTYRDKLKNLRK
jgi:hypothetical protein